jgi:hypothetical protein
LLSRVCALEGLLKLCGIGTLLGMTTPCGLAMLLLGVGVLLMGVESIESSGK